jgi:alpha-ribazole phosphatase
MNDLLFIRHAETHMAGAFCGQSDPPVNAAGLRQIQILIETLRSESIAAVFTSDLQRSVTTARALAESFDLPCITRPALREIDFGKWEGLTWDEVEELDSAFAQQWLESFPDLTPPGGESIELFEARVMAEMDYLITLSESRSIIVVSHAGVMRVVLRNLCGFDEKTAWALTRPYCCTVRYAHHLGSDRRLMEVAG